ncbi:MAG: hypothetical protein GXO70_10910 [Acidobacteria bacterium]|nr:hypothetical protein [Acidobacteriota bacterium]
MKKIVISIVLLAVIVAFGGVSYEYLIIRKGNQVYFMGKDTGTFDRVYLDVSGWSFVDYGMHPKISTFMASKGVLKKGNNWKKKLQKKIDVAKEEIKSFKEKASEN